MSKVLFNIEPEIDFDLFCISSHYKDYRLCWEMNRALDLNFKRMEEYYLGSKDQPGDLFTQYGYQDNTAHMQYYLLANRCIPETGPSRPEDLFPAEDSVKLMPELVQVDYLMLIHGQTTVQQLEDIQIKLNRLTMIQKAWIQDVEPLRSKYNLFR